MKQLMRWVCLGLIIASTVPSIAEEPQQAPNIEGTYRLVSRTHPDGTVLRAPDVMGLYTVTKSHKSVNVSWREGHGKLFFLTRVVTYRLTATEYSETNLFTITRLEDEVSYDSSAQTTTSPVKLENGRLAFQLPAEPPFVVFENGKFTATLPGTFVDAWERVQ